MEFCIYKNFEVEYNPPRPHAGMGAVERAIQTLQNLIIANLKEKIGSTKDVNRALRVKRFTIHTGLNGKPFELNHGRKSRSKLTNIVIDEKIHSSDWKTRNVSKPPKQFRIHVSGNEKPE